MDERESVKCKEEEMWGYLEVTRLYAECALGSVSGLFTFIAALTTEAFVTLSLKPQWCYTGLFSLKTLLFFAFPYLNRTVVTLKRGGFKLFFGSKNDFFIHKGLFWSLKLKGFLQSQKINFSKDGKGVKLIWSPEGHFKVATTSRFPVNFILSNRSVKEK